MAPLPEHKTPAPNIPLLRRHKNPTLLAAQTSPENAPKKHPNILIRLRNPILLINSLQDHNATPHPFKYQPESLTKLRKIEAVF